LIIPELKTFLISASGGKSLPVKIGFPSYRLHIGYPLVFISDFLFVFISNFLLCTAEVNI
jgi:hypothetical protein